MLMRPMPRGVPGMLLVRPVVRRELSEWPETEPASPTSH